MNIPNAIRLAFAKIRAIGFPYHGIVRNGEYLIPGGEVYNDAGVKVDHKKIITNGMNGALFVLRPAITQSPKLTSKEVQAEAKNQRVWRNYALWNPDTRYLNGIPVGTSQFHHIYPDGKNLWGITVEMYAQHIELYVTDLIGRIDTTDQTTYPQFKRKLGANIKFKLDPSWPPSAPLHRCVVMPHPNGKKFLINVYECSEALGGYCEFLHLGGSMVIKSKDGTGNFVYGELANVIEVTLSGIGSTVKSNLGAGIYKSASVTLYEYRHIYTCYYRHLTYVPGAGYFYFCYGGTAKLMRVYKADGSLGWILNHTYDTWGVYGTCNLHPPPYRQDLCIDSIDNILLSYYSFVDIDTYEYWECTCDYGVWAYGSIGAYFTYYASPRGKAHPYGSAPPTSSYYASYQPVTDTWAQSEEEEVGWL